MHVQKNQTRNIIITLFIVAIAAIRLGINSNGPWHALTSFSPIGAMALFSGVYFTHRGAAFAVPLVTLLISDIILSLTIYSQFSHGFLYSGWYWVYGAFALMVLAGKFFIRTVTLKNVLLASIAITFIHWIVTDLGVWIGSKTYPSTIMGFWTCLAAAIPFEKNFLLGSLFYSAVMFGGFEWMRREKVVSFK